jgi:hypothetical protein
VSTVLVPVLFLAGIAGLLLLLAYLEPRRDGQPRRALMAPEVARVRHVGPQVPVNEARKAA